MSDKSSILEKSFENYLIKRGYAQTTPSGLKSTVYDYLKRICRVCEKENMNWDTLGADIDNIVARYDANGIEAEYGAKSHNAVISALKRYQEFIKEVL